MNDAPRVSVVVNCYNGEPFLHEALDSVLAQTFTGWELVLWDDQSTDASAAVLAGYAEPRFRYFRAPRHTPLGEARALAIAQAEGQWLAFLDQDDLWLPDKLARQLALVDAEPRDEPGLVYGRATRFTASGPAGDYDDLHGPGRLPEGDIFQDLMRDANFIAVSSAMISRRAYEEAGGAIPSEFQVAAEYYLFAAISRARRARALQEVCCRYRMHDSNLSATSARRAHEEALRVLELWSGAIAPALLRRRRRVYETLLGWEDVRAGHPVRGGMRILWRGSVGYVLSRPAARVLRAARRRWRERVAWSGVPRNAALPPAPTIDWGETRRRLHRDRQRLRAALASGQAPPAPWLTLYPPFLCVFLYRLAHQLLAHGHGRLSRLVWQLNLFLTGADIHPRCDLGGGLLILHPVAVSLSGRAGRDLTVMARAGLGGELSRLDDVGAGPGLPSLGEGVALGPHAGVLGPVRVGNGARLGAGCIVTRDVGPGARVLPFTDAGPKTAAPKRGPVERSRPSTGPIGWRETRRRLASDRDRVGRRLSLAYACAWLYRMSHYLHRRGLTRLASICWQLNHGLTGADIHPRADLGGGLLVPHPAGVTLDGQAGCNLTVSALAGLEAEPDRVGDAGGPLLPALGDDVELGPLSVVVGDVRVGSGARIGAGAIVTETMAEGASVQGAPARIQGGVSRAGPSRATRCRDLGHGRVSSLRLELGEDLGRFLRQSEPGRPSAGPGRVVSALLMPGILSLLLHRCAHCLHVKGFLRGAGCIAGLNRLVFKLSIPPATCIAGGCFLPHPAGIVIHGSAGRDLALYSLALCLPLGPLGGRDLPGPSLGDRVWLGVLSAVVGPVNVGDDVRLAFRVVLARDVPSDSLVSSRAMRTRVELPAQVLRESTDS